MWSLWRGLLYEIIVSIVTCNCAAVVFTFLSSVNPSTSFSSIDFLIIYENLSWFCISFSYSLTCFYQCRMNDSDEPFQAPVPNLAVVMYVRIVDDYKLALVDVNMCAKSSLWMACAL